MTSIDHLFYNYQNLRGYCPFVRNAGDYYSSETKRDKATKVLQSIHT